MKNQMKKTILAFVAFILVPTSHGAPNLAGEYLCDDCQGYLTIKANQDATYRVVLQVGGGSCGGLVYAKNDVAVYSKDKFTLKWKLKGKTCKTEVLIDGTNASVSDSCVKPEEEEGSTCAVLGDYTKRGSRK